MGLAFKPNIDDLRESPAVTVVEALEKEGLQLLKVEPNLQNGRAEGLTEYNEAIKKADIIVYLVAHKEFFQLNNDKVVLDFCGVLKE